MNPWGFVFIALGAALIIMGVKGSQHNVAAMLTGHATSSGSGGQQQPSPKMPAGPNPHGIVQ